MLNAPKANKPVPLRGNLSKLLQFGKVEDLSLPAYIFAL